MTNAAPQRALTLGAIAVAVGTAGCAFEPGEAYGQITATLDARYSPLEDRATDDGFEKLNTDFQVRLTSATLTVDAVELIDSGVGAAVQSFDPANPPPGYSLCHGGHCHADDGRLVDYEDIAAELAGSSGGAQTTAATMTPGAVDMLAPSPLALECAPDCALDEGYLVLARLTASRLALRGQVRDSRATPRIAGVADWRVDLSLLEPIPLAGEDGQEQTAETPAGAFELRLDLPVGEDEPPRIALELLLPTDAKLLDRVDFASVASTPSGLIDLDAEDGAGARAVLAHNFADIQAGATATRTDE